MLTTRLTALATIVWRNVKARGKWCFTCFTALFHTKLWYVSLYKLQHTSGVHSRRKIYTFNSIPACIIKFWMFSVTSTKCIQKWFSHSLTNVYVQGKELRNKVQSIFNQTNVPFLLLNSRSKRNWLDQRHKRHFPAQRKNFEFRAKVFFQRNVGRVREVLVRRLSRQWKPVWRSDRWTLSSLSS